MKFVNKTEETEANGEKWEIEKRGPSGIRAQDSQIVRRALPVGICDTIGCNIFGVPIFVITGPNCFLFYFAPNLKELQLCMLWGSNPGQPCWKKLTLPDWECSPILKSSKVVGGTCVGALINQGSPNHFDICEKLQKLRSKAAKAVMKLHKLQRKLQKLQSCFEHF